MKKKSKLECWMLQLFIFIFKPENKPHHPNPFWFFFEIKKQEEERTENNAKTMWMSFAIGKFTLTLCYTSHTGILSLQICRLLSCPCSQSCSVQSSFVHICYHLHCVKHSFWKQKCNVRRPRCWHWVRTHMVWFMRGLPHWLDPPIYSDTW